MQDITRLKEEENKSIFQTKRRFVFAFFLERAFGESL